MTRKASMYQTLVEQSPVAIAVHEIIRDEKGVPVDYRFLAANAAFGQQTGLDSARIIGQTVRQVLPGIEETDYISRYGNVVDTGVAIDFESYSPPLKRHYKTDAFKIGDNEFAVIFTEITKRKQALARLEESERRNRALLAAFPDMYFVFDAAGRYRDMHAHDDSLLAMAGEQIIGQLVEHVLPDEITRRFRPVLDRVLQKQKMESFGYDLTINGSCHHFEARIAPLDAGHALALVRDMTELKTYAREVEQFKVIFDQSGVGMAVSDPSGVLTYVNQAMAEMHGYAPDECIGRSIHIFHNDAQRPVVERLFGQIIHHGGFQAVEVPHAHRDGHTFDLLMTVQVLRDSKGTPYAHAATAMDVTELREAEERYRGLFDGSIAAIYVFDANKRFVDTNQAGIELLGYTREEYRRMSMQDADVDSAAVACAHQELFSGSKLVNFEHRLKRKDGAIITVLNNSSPLTDAEGKMIGIISTLIDITAQKQAEAELQQAQKMESVGRLAGGVAHDYNNMLQVILGSAELALIECDPAAGMRRELQEIRGAALRSQEITRQLLAFARKQAIQPKPLDLNTAIENMLKILRRLIGENIRLVWRPGTAAAPIFMDPSQVDQVLANLCVNARDAIEDTGEITVVTRAEHIPAPRHCSSGLLQAGDYIRLDIADTGHGMDKDIVAQIFEPFFTTKPSGHGTGLGLTTIYGIVTQNQGQINVTSAPGQGTVFSLFLPRYQGEIAEDDATARNDTVPRGTETVLIVEDEKTVLRQAARLLERQGYRVLQAVTVAEALEQVRTLEGPLHLLLTDVIMPEMNGRVLSGKLREIHPELKCLYMSGYTADVISRQGLIDAHVHFIQKPFSIRDLAVKVRSVLDDVNPSPAT